MDNSPLISVIMPAYNAEKTLIQAVQSVINQTYCNWELLIIDDCSIDNTYALMQKLQLSNTKIKILKNHQNAGVSESRNKGCLLYTSVMKIQTLTTYWMWLVLWKLSIKRPSL